jgi:hypothetical protein
VLVTPQSLFILAKIACTVSQAVATTGADSAVLGESLLAISQHLGTDREQGAAGLDPDSFGRELIANQLFNRNPSQPNIMARFVRRWLQLPYERASEARVIDLADAFSQGTGVPLTDLQIIGCTLWSASLVSQSCLFPPEYFEPLGWTPERFSRTLDLICADTTRLRAKVTDEIGRFGLSWSISAFEQFPLVRLGNGNVLVIDPDLLVRRVFGWLPLFDIMEGLKARGQPDDRKLAVHAKLCLEHLTEVYALEVLNNIAGKGDTAQRLYNDTDLETAFARNGRQKADAAIDYGNAWVVVEVTTSQPQRATVSGTSAEALDADLGKLVDEATQIEATIDALRIDESRLTGASPQVGRRYFPLLIASEGFPINPTSLRLLRARLRTADVLQKPDLSPLEVIDLEELEIIEGLQERGGPSLCDLLARKASSSMANAGMREYILSSVDRRITSGARIQKLMRTIIDSAAVALSNEKLY